MIMNDDEMVMQPKEGGIPIPPNDHAHLEPGGYHIMLMDVSEPIQPGDMVPFTLTFDDGSTLQMDAVAKEFTGADEDYDSGHDG
jgi:copper(I)-binding protein